LDVAQLTNAGYLSHCGHRSNHSNCAESANC
jgi:hypothetical protein